MVSHGLLQGRIVLFPGLPLPYPNCFLFRSVCSASQSSGDAVSWQVLDILRPSLSHCIRTFPAKNLRLPWLRQQAPASQPEQQAQQQLISRSYSAEHVVEHSSYSWPGLVGYRPFSTVLLLGDPACCDLSWRSPWFCSASPGTSQAHPLLHRSVPGDSPDMSAQAFKECEELVWITSCAKCLGRNSEIHAKCSSQLHTKP